MNSKFNAVFVAWFLTIATFDVLVGTHYEHAIMALLYAWMIYAYDQVQALNTGEMRHDFYPRS